MACMFKMQLILRNSYTGTQSVLGGYVMVDMPLTHKFRMEVGLGMKETKWSQSKKKGIEKGQLNDNDILPAINLTYTLIDKMNIRFAYTRTLSRPTFREIAPFASFSPVAPTIVGNPDLKRALIDNFDLKWEYFMKPNEVISFGVFYKNFTDPIEMVDNPVAVNPEISYQNVEQAQNYGVETEFRKKLDFINAFRNMFFGINFAYIILKYPSIHKSWNRSGPWFLIILIHGHYLDRHPISLMAYWVTTMKKLDCRRMLFTI